MSSYRRRSASLLPASQSFAPEIDTAPLRHASSQSVPEIASTTNSQSLITETIQHLEQLRLTITATHSSFQTPREALGTLKSSSNSDSENEKDTARGNDCTIQYLKNELATAKKSLREEREHSLTLGEELRASDVRARKVSGSSGGRRKKLSQSEIRMHTLEGEWQYQENQIENLLAELNHTKADLAHADKTIVTLQRLTAPIYLLELARLRAASIKSWSRPKKTKSEDLIQLSEREIESALRDFVDLPADGEELDQYHIKMIKAIVKEGVFAARAKAMNPTQSMIEDGLYGMDLGLFIRPYAATPFATKSLEMTAAKK